jgi:hypothetical protein
MRRPGPLAAALAAITALSPAASPARAASPCDRAECRQFDFWVGDWNVFGRDGRLEGTNLVERQLSGCVLQENWQGADGSAGKSFNLWTASDSLWHQTWVSANGTLLSLAGTLRDRAMVMEGGPTGRQAPGTRNRITWTPMPDGSVTQEWDVSRDGGKNWSEIFFGIYRKKP